MLRLAWRNIWRNRRRSGITFGSIAFAIVIAVFVRSMQLGIYQNLIDNIVTVHTGYLQVHPPKSGIEVTLDQSFDPDKKIISTLSQIPGVKTVAPRIESSILASDGIESRGIHLSGISVLEETQITNPTKRLLKGKIPEKDDRFIAMSEGLAAYFSVDIGDTILLIGQGYHAQPAYGKYAIGGIFHLGSPELNERWAYLSIEEANWLFRTENNITSIVILPEVGFSLEEITNEIKKALPDQVEVFSWKEMIPEIVQAIKADNAGNLVMVAMLYLIIAIGILGTVIMMTEERKFETGLLHSIGMRKSKIVFVMMMESMMLSLSGIVCGLLIATPLVAWFCANPIPLPESFAEGVRSFGVEPLIEFSGDSSIFFAQAFIVLGITMITTAYPWLSVRKMKAAGAIRI